MDKYKICFNGEEPKYIQISNHIKMLINSKNINDGDKLPTIRALAVELSVNKITIVNSYKKLEADGYAYQKMGSGTYAKRKETVQKLKVEYVKEIKKMKKEINETIIDFTGESSKEIFFPIEEFKEIINIILNRDGAEALTTQETLGYSELRKTINRTFWGSNIDIDNILIVSGAQQGIDIASKAILNINDNVIVEKPTYGGAISVFKWRRANVFEVPIEDGGIDIEQFETIIKKNKIKCFYTMSYFQNPTGISYTEEIKERILELAKKYDFYIIEDDYLSEIIYDENMIYEPFKKLDKNDRVIYIRSFSKIFLPGIRLGYLIYPDLFKETMHNSKVNTDIATSTLMQRSLDLYIKEGYYKEHLAKMRAQYMIRYTLMKKYINKELGNHVKYRDPKGGLSFFIKLKDKSINSKVLFYRLKKRGVYITPGSIFYKTLEEGVNQFRISFSQVSNEDIREGVRIIKEEIERWNI